MSRLPAALLAAIALAGCSACDAPSARAGRAAAEGWIVTQLPADRERAEIPAPADELALDVRYPAGSRIVFVPDSGDVASSPQVLSGDLLAAGAPSLTLDGTAVLFAGRAAGSTGWAIYRSRLDAATPRVVLKLEGDCADPRELAHDRLVAACRLPDANAAWSLYTAGLDGSDPQRITFGPGSAIDPLPLRDGRILFSMEQGPGPGRPHGGAFALFSLNPDGTLLEPFSGSHRSPRFKHRARQTYDDAVVYLASAHRGAGRVERTEMRRPHGVPRTAWPAASGAAEAASFAASAVEPLPGGDYLVATSDLAATSNRDATSAIYRIAPDGRATPVYDDPERDDVEAISSRPAPPPRGRPSGRQPGRDTATLICYDAARGDGGVTPTAGVSTPARVAVEVLEAGRSASAGTAKELGVASVHPDGSFQVEVPTDLPIRVRTVDADGVELARSDWFWMRPGEVRACFGCHEDRASAPPNRAVLALVDPPTDLSAEPSEGLEARAR